MAEPTNNVGSADGYLSTIEAAEFLGVSPQTLRNYADRELIKCYRVFSGHRHFKKEDLQEFLNRFSTGANG